MEQGWSTADAECGMTSHLVFHDAFIYYDVGLNAFTEKDHTAPTVSAFLLNWHFSALVTLPFRVGSPRIGHSVTRCRICKIVEIVELQPNKNWTSWKAKAIFRLLRWQRNIHRQHIYRGPLITPELRLNSQSCKCRWWFVLKLQVAFNNIQYESITLSLNEKQKWWVEISRLYHNWIICLGPHSLYHC